MSDEITEGIRAIGRAFAALHGNDVNRMADELRRQESESGRSFVRYASPPSEKTGVEIVRSGGDLKSE